MTFKEVQKLIDENEYLNDINEELEESLLANNEEMKIFAKLYNEFTKKMTDNTITLQNYRSELAEIERKEENVGKLSKKQTERKEFLQKEIDRMMAEHEVSKENKQEAQKSYHELADKKAKSTINKKIEANENKIKENEEQIVKAYKDIKRKINKLDKEIKSKSEKMLDIYSLGGEEYLQLVTEISIANKEKQELINENEKLLKLIEKTGLVKVEQTKVEKQNEVVKNHDHTKEENIEDNKEQVEAEDDEFEELEEIEEDENLENHEELEMFEDLDDDENLGKTEANTTTPLYNESDGPIFVDESRIDKDHSWMTATNAANLGYLNNEALKEEKSASEVEEPEEEIVENIPIPEEAVLQEEEMNGPVIDSYPEEAVETPTEETIAEPEEQISEKPVQDSVLEEPKVQEPIEHSQDNREIDIQKIQEKLNNQAYASPAPAEIDVEKIQQEIANQASAQTEPILNYEDLNNYDVEYVQLPENFTPTESTAVMSEIEENLGKELDNIIENDNTQTADTVKPEETANENLKDEYDPAPNLTTAAIDAAQMVVGKIKNMMKASKELSQKILSSAKNKKLEPLYYENMVKGNEEEMQRGSR